MVAAQKAKGHTVDPDAERNKWPQDWWWRDDWDELRPRSLSDEEPAAKRKRKPPTDLGPDRPPPEPSAQVKERERRVREALEELKKQAKQELDWLDEMSTAFVNIDGVWKELTLRREGIAALRARQQELKDLMAKLPPTRSDDYLEDFFQWGLATLRKFQSDWNFEGTSPPRKVGQLKEKVARMIEKAEEEIRQLERDQDQLLEQTLQKFRNIVDELDARGRKSKFERVRERTIAQEKLVAEKSQLARMQLLLAAGRENEFRQAARELIAKGKQLSVIRYFEGMHFLQKKDPRRALHAFRMALLERLDVDRKQLQGIARQQSEREKQKSAINRLGEREDLEKAAAEVAKDVDRKHWKGELRAEAIDDELIKIAPTRYWIRKLELEYLRGIDGKAMGEAAAVRDRCISELSKHGEPGFWGYVSDVLTSGITNSVGAIGDNISKYSVFLGPQAQLPSRVTDAFVEATPADQVSRRAGLHESLAEHQGTVLDDASRQHIGIKLIERLRSRGIALGAIRRMKTEEFVAEVQEQFGWQLKTSAAQKMMQSMHYALENPDLKILESWSSQSMDIESGKKYYDANEFSTAISVSVPLMGLEIDIVDLANVKNVALFLGPNALVSQPGSLSSAGQIAQQTSAAEKARQMITLKQAVAQKVGLNKVVNALAGTTRGRDAIRNMLLLDKSMGFIGRSGADMSMMLLAQQGAEFAGRSGAAMWQGLTGRELDDAAKADQQWWARAFGEAASLAGAFGLADYDVAVGLMRQSQQKAIHNAGLVLAKNGLQESIDMDRQTLTLMRKHQDAIESTLSRSRLRPAADPLDSRAVPAAREPLLLPPGELEGVYRLKDNIKDELRSVVRQIKSPDAAPAAVRRREILKTAYQAAEALENGFTGEASSWQRVLREATDSLEAELNFVTAGSRSLPSAGDALTGTAAPPASQVMQQSIAPRSLLKPHEIEFDGRVFRSADSLMEQADPRAFGAAGKAFREMGVLFQEAGNPNSMLARQAMAKAQHADEALRAARRVKLAQQLPDTNTHATEPFSDPEMRMLSSANLSSKAAGGEAGGIWEAIKSTGGRTHPRKIYLRVGTVGENGATFVTKRPQRWFKAVGTGNQLEPEIEEVMSFVCRRADIPAPAARCGTLMVDDQRLFGVYLRDFAGEPLAKVTVKNPGMRYALQDQLGQEIPVRLLGADWDPHGGNQFVARNAKLASGDHGNATFLKFDAEGDRWLAELRNIEGNTSAIATQRQSELMKKLMTKARDRSLQKSIMLNELQNGFWSRVPFGRQYWDVADMHRRTTMSQVQKTVSKIQSIGEDELKNKLTGLGRMTKNESDLVLEVLKTRQGELADATAEYLQYARSPKKLPRFDSRVMPPQPPAPNLGSEPWLKTPQIKPPPPIGTR
jgi:hypothetical protein